MSAFSRLEWRRLGLRARITLLFTLGAAVLSIVMAGVTYALVRSALIRQRDERAVQIAYGNARVVQDALKSDPPSIQPILSGLPSPGSSRPLVFARGQWTALTSEYGSESIPAALRTRVIDEGVPSRMMSRFAGGPVLAVGIPLPSVGALAPTRERPT